MHLALKSPAKTAASENRVCLSSLLHGFDGNIA